MIRAVPLAAAFLALLAVATANVQTSNNPVMGIDVVVKKQPNGGSRVVATTGRDGGFSARVRIEGNSALQDDSTTR